MATAPDLAASLPLLSREVAAWVESVAALTRQRTTGIATIAVTVHNQRNELVLTGEQKYLLRKRRPEASLTQAR